jgi:hypothetical protein
MNIQRNYLFFPDKEGTEKSGYAQDAKLRLRIRFDKNNVVNFNVGYRVTLAKWVVEAQRCKAGTSYGKTKVSALEINNEIQRLESIAEIIFKQFEVKDYMPTVNEFRDEFNLACGRKIEVLEAKTFFNFFDEFVRTAGYTNEWSKGTFQKFSTIKSHLLSFNSKLDFETLTELDLENFVRYLHKLDFHNTTIQKDVNFVKWFLRWSFEKGYYTGNLHLTFKPKFKGTDGNQKEVIHLTWDELMRLYNFNVPLSKQYLERVRDVFCFTCFTSLRYSDVAKLSRSVIYQL